jgi:cobalt-zinc-cadmium efflux system membrane fusion protein
MTTTPGFDRSKESPVKNKQMIAIVIVLLVGAAAIALALATIRTPKPADPHGHGHGAAEDAGHAEHGEEAHDHAEHTDDAHDHGEGDEGPKGGRLLTDGEFAAEITIFERGTPPHFRVYFYESGRPVDPADTDLTITLRRLGGRSETLLFKREEDYLASTEVVEEPHSFDVVVDVTRKDRKHRWEYASPEFRATLPAETSRGSGIEVSTAGPAKIRDALKVYGRVAPNEDRMKHVIPRFPGIVKQVFKRIGDRVAKDDVLAVVESNESLRAYDVQSDIGGVVIEKHATPGEFAGEGEAIFVVADLSTVWIDFSIYRQDFPRIKVGQRVVIEGGEGMPTVEGKISYLSPYGAPNTQTMLARVMLPNQDGVWRPGLFVTGEIFLDESEVPVAVEVGAIQTFQDWTVVFVNEGNAYEPLLVELGRRDSDWVEVVSGLESGMRYVSKNSFIIKADILKAGAAHEH